MFECGMVHTGQTEPHIDARVSLWRHKIAQKWYSVKRDLARYLPSFYDKKMCYSGDILHIQP